MIRGTIACPTAHLGKETMAGDHHWRVLISKNQLQKGVATAQSENANGLENCI